jgi:hypothetical protein
MTKASVIIRIIAGTLITLFGIFLGSELFTQIDKSDYEINNDRFIELKGTVRFDPVYRSSKNEGKYFQVELFEYPDLKFINTAEFLIATNYNSIKKEVHYFDSATITVLKKDFDRLTGNSRSTIEKIFDGSNKLVFYSFKSKGKEFVDSLYEAAIKHKHDNIFGTLFISVLLIGIGMYTCFKRG